MKRSQTIFITIVALASLIYAAWPASSRSITGGELKAEPTLALVAYTTTQPAIPAPEPRRPYGETEITMLAKVIWAEARGVPSTTEQAAVVWCVLNRVDSQNWDSTIAGVITARSQFAYFESAPATEELKDLAADVLDRWWREKGGENGVGRILPAEYTFFCGDGAHNYFRQRFEQAEDYWDWSLPSPYRD